MGLQTLDDLAVAGRTIGVRVDLNSPLTDAGELADDGRLRAHAETIGELLDREGRVAVLAHQGRPGGADFESLAAHARRLDDLLEAPIDFTDATFSEQARDVVDDLADGEAVVLENTRFYSEEYMEFEPDRAAETHLVRRLAPHLDAYVNDAFAAAHRSQPSLVGFPRTLPAYAGRVMEREIDVLGAVDETPPPRAYVVGGAKVADALEVVEHGLETGLADEVLTSGLVANVFLLAAGYDLGEESRDVVAERGYEGEIDRAADLLDEHADRIQLPVDLAVDSDGERVDVAVADLPPASDGPVMDIGERTVDAYGERLDSVGTAVLNGPAGVFEDPLFEAGTRDLFERVAAAEYSIAGGGDTGAAIERFDIEGFDHVSSGGGAALRMLTGDRLPAIAVLEGE
ncbi:MAG: phosphoglycerate kinase [Halanaeroarchaeum sp.]